MNKLSVKFQMGLVAALAVSGMLAFTVINGLSIDHLKRLGDVRTSIVTIKSNVLIMQRHERDFFTDNNKQNQDKFNETYALILENLSDLANKYEVIAEGFEVDPGIAERVHAYHQAFEKIIKLKASSEAELQPNVYGQLRAAVQNVDTYLGNYQIQTEKQVEEAVDYLKTKMIIASTITILITVGFIFFVARRLIAPLLELNNLMSQASSDLDISVESNVAGSKEISSMANAFNRMISEFRNIMVQMNRTSDTLSESSDDLNASVNTANEVSVSLNSESQRVAEAMTRMTASVQSVAEQAGTAVEVSIETNQVADKGRSVVLQNQEEVQALMKNVVDAASIIRNLSEESESIGAVLGVIQSIAEQTNLLALNAAIEAARAGEQGRGFAVVADEVRTLAQRSEESTQEIQGIVTRLQTAAGQAVIAMDKSQDKAEENSKRSKVASEALDDIIAAVIQVQKMNTEIAESANQQSIVSDEINQNLVNLEEITEKAKESTSRTDTVGKILSASTSELRDLFSRVKLE